LCVGLVVRWCGGAVAAVGAFGALVPWCLGALVLLLLLLLWLCLVCCSFSQVLALGFRLLALGC